MERTEAEKILGLAKTASIKARTKQALTPEEQHALAKVAEAKKILWKIEPALARIVVTIDARKYLPRDFTYDKKYKKITMHKVKQFLRGILKADIESAQRLGKTQLTPTLAREFRRIRRAEEQKKFEEIRRKKKIERAKKLEQKLAEMQKKLEQLKGKGKE